MRKLITIVVILAVIALGTSKAIDWWNYNINTPVSTSSHAVPFHVDQGETSSDIATNLSDVKLIRSALAFDMYSRMTDAGPKFQYGSFVLNTNMNVPQIVAALQHGHSDQKVVTMPEGFPLREQAKRVEASHVFTGADYLQAAKDPSWAAQYSFLPPQPVNADYPYEGYLFPDTYLVDPAAGVRGLVKQQLDQFAAVMSPDLRAQLAKSTPGRPAESVNAIVILASMVDREANTDSDRGKVCSVYYNRLAANMPLGVDATLLYALGRLSPEPTYQELQLNSPYNTRTHAGLPPSPISNPGKAALLACVNPPKTSFLYYFTDRQGTTHFETNSQDFQNDIAKYGVSGS